MNDTKAESSGAGQAATSVPLRGFWALFFTQFQGAFSDNSLKWLAIFLITGMGLTSEKRDQLVGIVGALFALPFILFSMTGGFLADHFSKRTVTIGVKFFEIFVMLCALGGLALNNIYLVIGCVFLMGVHSAIFGPSKYGLLPELLPERKLSWGNGVLELGTFLAIIGGTVAGGSLCKYFAGRQAWSGAVLIALAGLGLLTSLGISKIPAADPRKRFRINMFADLWSQLKLIRRDRVLWLAMLGNTYFFAIAALIQFLIVIYATDVLHLTDPTQSSYLQAATAIGIGLGSFAAGYLSGGKIEYGLIPLGSVGLTICAALLGRRGLTFGHAALDLSLLGFFGGFFIGPIAALLQHRPEKENKGGVLAAANLLSFVGIFLASAVYFVLVVALKLSPPTVFLLVALLTLGATFYVVVLLPDSLLRFVLWVCTRTLYRIRIVGRDNIPAKGGALFVCNHVSWMDALLLLAATDRQVRFVMFKDIYEQAWLKPFCRILGVIPISSEQRPRELLQSLHAASEAIRNGEVVCIFAEGQITRIGQLLPFRRGMERIMKDVDAPIIPIALDGVSGTPSSFKQGRFVWRLPSHIPLPVTVSFGRALPGNTSAFIVRQAVQELQAGAWEYRRAHLQPLHRQFVRTARRFPRRFALADPQTPRVTFGGALTKSVFLARRLRKIWAGQEMVGLLLPPSVPGALVNWAALLCGKVPVNLNYTLSSEALASCVKQCDIKTVITSRLLLEKLKLTVPGKIIYLEDVVSKDRSPGAGEKLVAFILARLTPDGLLDRMLHDHAAPSPHPSPLPSHGERRGSGAAAGQVAPDPLEGSRNTGSSRYQRLDALATVIFSSGSTGEPKGVMLSHYNIGANIAQMEQVFALGKRDCIL
ncbi:MAG TPA: MFS transporter, partial [Dongiaceae bacterium]|nr:MFS transporter [Dongiaceae bacterium]